VLAFRFFSPSNGSRRSELTLFFSLPSALHEGNVRARSKIHHNAPTFARGNSSSRERKEETLFEGRRTDPLSERKTPFFFDAGRGGRRYSFCSALVDVGFSLFFFPSRGRVMKFPSSLSGALEMCFLFSSPQELTNVLDKAEFPLFFFVVRHAFLPSLPSAIRNESGAFPPPARRKLGLREVSA